MIPQAFTTRDMSEAYKWLQTLPPSVREEMKSMEQVVSLYLRAKRLGGTVPTKEDLSVGNQTPPQSGGHSPGHSQIHVQGNGPHTSGGLQETSKSSQDFQKTLKSLRHELDQFDFAANPPAGHPGANHQTIGGNFGAGQAATAQESHSVITHGSQKQPPEPGPVPAATVMDIPHSNPGSWPTALRMDPRSRQLLHDIREGFNLSSDLEVIRMSLVLAHKALRDLLK